MSKTFTDDDGNKWEAVPRYEEGFAFALKPVQKAEKKEYRLIFRDATEPTDDLYFEKYALTKPQAEAIAAAIEALMEFIQGDDNGVLVLHGEAHEARKLMQKENL